MGKSRDETYIEKLLEIGLEVVGEYTTAGKHCDLKCLVCGEISNATPKSRTQTYRLQGTNGCPACFQKRNKGKLDDTIPQRLFDVGVELLEVYKGVNINHQAKCLNCNNIWNARPSNSFESYKNTQTNGCPTCARSNRPKDETIPQQLLDIGIQLLEPYKTVNDPHKIKCLTCCYVWEKRPTSTFQSFRENKTNGCPKCARERLKRVIKNDTYPQQLLNIGLELLEPYKGAKEHHKIKCLSCSHEWEATPISKIRNNVQFGTNGCPNCHEMRTKNELEKINQKNIQKIIDRGFQIIGGYIGYKNKLLVKNVNCGHQWETTPEHIIGADVNCKICNDVVKSERYKEINRIRHEKYLETATEWEAYKSEVYKLTLKSYGSNKNIINPSDLPRILAGVDSGHQLDHIVPIRYCFDNSIPSHLCADYRNLQIIKWEDNLISKDKLKVRIPSFLCEYISKENRSTVLINSLQKIFPNWKIDNDLILSMSKNDKIIFFHFLEDTKEYKVGKNHLNQILNIHDNLTCIQIFEDEVFTNPDLIFNKINHYTNQSEAISIYARNCKIQEIDSKIKNNFLTQFHIQGSDNSKINLGAFFEDKLVAVMTFCEPRVALGAKGDRKQYKDIWELSRFTTDTNFKVIGIASKLLSHFKNNYVWKEIFSFADRRWSVGDLYFKLGFEIRKITPPTYFYIIDGERKHRWNFRKDILKENLSNFDPSLTEYQNMLNNGIDRVWDCGNIKFIAYNS